VWLGKGRTKKKIRMERGKTRKRKVFCTSRVLRKKDVKLQISEKRSERRSSYPTGKQWGLQGIDVTFDRFLTTERDERRPRDEQTAVG